MLSPLEPVLFAGEKAIRKSSAIAKFVAVNIGHLVYNLTTHLNHYMPITHRLVCIFGHDLNATAEAVLAVMEVRLCAVDIRAGSETLAMSPH